MHFSSENLPGVNPLVMNYKIRYSKNQKATRPARYVQSFPLCGGRKVENTVQTCKAVCNGSHGGRLAQCVSQPDNCQLLSATFSQLGICKKRSHILCNYSCWANEELQVIPQIFLANYVNEGDLLKFSFSDYSSSYTCMVCVVVQMYSQLL